MTYTYNGLGLNLGNLSRLSNAETRSLAAENLAGAKGQGGATRRPEPRTVERPRHWLEGAAMRAELLMGNSLSSFQHHLNSVAL